MSKPLKDTVVNVSAIKPAFYTIKRKGSGFVVLDVNNKEISHENIFAIAFQKLQLQIKKDLGL